MDGQVIDGFGIVGNVFGEPWKRRYVHFYVRVTNFVDLNGDVFDAGKDLDNEDDNYNEDEDGSDCQV